MDRVHPLLQVRLLKHLLSKDLATREYQSGNEIFVGVSIALGYRTALRSCDLLCGARFTAIAMFPERIVIHNESLSFPRSSSNRTS